VTKISLQKSPFLLAEWFTVGSMKKRDLIQAVALHTGLSTKEAGKAVEGTIDVILANVAKGEIVNLSGFAKFAKIKRPARQGRNPATGETIQIKAKTVAKITALKGFKDIALGVAPAPKLNTKPIVAAAAPAKKAAVKKAAPAKKTAKKAAPAKKKAVAKKVVKKAAPKKTVKKAAAKRR
jgi:DNA-binding protein HU-beta